MGGDCLYVLMYLLRICTPDTMGSYPYLRSAPLVYFIPSSPVQAHFPHFCRSRVFRKKTQFENVSTAEGGEAHTRGVLVVHVGGYPPIHTHTCRCYHAGTAACQLTRREMVGKIPIQLMCLFTATSIPPQL